MTDQDWLTPGLMEAIDRADAEQPMRFNSVKEMHAEEARRWAAAQLGRSNKISMKTRTKMTDQDWVTDEVAQAIIDAGHEPMKSFSSINELLDELKLPQ